MAAGKITPGKRRDLAEDEYALEQGEYGKNPEGKWYARPPAPGFSCGGLGNHTITEHDDGTITVEPSILSDGRADGRTWHGYLVKGIWNEV